MSISIGESVYQVEIDSGLYRAVGPTRARLGGGPALMSDIGTRMGKGPRDDVRGPRPTDRERPDLRPERGYIAFTVPGMAAYIRRELH